MTLHVALFGEFGLGNLGNDLSCRAAKERLAEEVPDTEFSAMVRDTGRSAVAVAHAAKDEALLAQAGLDDYVLDIETVTADDILAAVATACADAGRFGPAADQVCRAARTSVGAEVVAVAALLDGVLEKR